MELVKRNQENGKTPGRGVGPAGMYRDLSEIFDNFFNEPSGRRMLPAVNISEDNEKYQLEVSAPGYKKDDLNISIEDDQLIISAEMENVE